MVSHGPYIDIEGYYSMGFDELDHVIELGYNVEFEGKTTLSTGMSDIYVRLMEDFDPTHTSDNN